MSASDLTAKLLAQENITIIRANTKTASFDVSSRVLTLPIWKNMTKDLEDMLQCHEVGHALFTHADEWLSSIEQFEGGSKRVFHGYMNVVEDARIEKLMKRRYPGIRKTFFSAYKQLIADDFFKLKGRNVNDMQLIDRINLYFKAGFSLGIAFSTEEKKLVNKVDSVETIAEAKAVALEIYEFAKAQAEKQHSETAEEDVTFSKDSEEDSEEDYEEDYEYDEEDYEYDEEDFDSLTKKEVQSAKTQSDTDSKIQSETDNNLNSSLQELADVDTIYEYYEFFTGLSHDPIVPFKKVIEDTAIVDNRIAEMESHSSPVSRSTHKQNFDKFMLESERMVSYLVKEFEMRKSAQAYKRTQVSKSGSLNMNKIHSYKLTDDIFRRITTIPNGKNHGMIFLLDWSGSMQDVITPTIRQVINLVMFCRRINIPFEVFAFTGQYQCNWSREKYSKNWSYINEVSMEKDTQYIFSDGMFNLLNLFSSKMTNSEFLTVARRFTSYYIQSAKGYNLGDTPLNEALLYLVDYIPSYIRRNNVEKMTLITLTDGQGGALKYSGKNIREHNFDSTSHKYKKINNFVRDNKTQKTYKITNEAQSQTEVLLKIIKDRYDISSLGFYICKNSKKTLFDAFHDNLGCSATEHDIDIMRSHFRENGFYSMMGTGRDDLFIIPDTSTKIIDEELKVDAELSAAAISRKFSRQMNTKRHSRILLDRFIGYVA